MKIKKLYDYIDKIAPFDTAMDFDNCGLLVGSRDDEFTKALLALDVTDSVIDEAEAIGADLIITHHPIIFNPVKRINSNSTIYKLVKSGIYCLAAHTNLDIADGGVNTALAEAIGLENVVSTDTQFMFTGNYPQPLTVHEFAAKVRDSLGCKGVRFTDIAKSIKTVAVSSGAGGSSVYAAAALGADAFVTGEIKHHEIMDSVKLNIAVVDAGHYKTEDIVFNSLIEKLQNEFPDTEFIKSKSFTDTINYI